MLNPLCLATVYFDGTAWYRENWFLLKFKTLGVFTAVWNGMTGSQSAEGRFLQK